MSLSLQQSGRPTRTTFVTEGKGLIRLPPVFPQVAASPTCTSDSSSISMLRENTTTNISTALLAALLSLKSSMLSSNNEQQATQSTSCCPLSIVDSLKYQSNSCLESWSSCVTCNELFLFPISYDSFFLYFCQKWAQVCHCFLNDHSFLPWYFY